MWSIVLCKAHVRLVFCMFVHMPSMCIGRRKPEEWGEEIGRVWDCAFEVVAPKLCSYEDFLITVLLSFVTKNYTYNNVMEFFG